MKRYFIIMLVVGLILAVGTAQALTLDPSMTGYHWDDGWTANGNGVPYWDNTGDPPKLGKYVSDNWGTLPTLVSTPINESGASGGAWVTDVTFTSPGSDWATILIEVAGLSDNNFFGIYAKGNPSNRAQLFAGSAGEKASATFNPYSLLGTKDFGFYLETRRGSSVLWTFYSESKFNTITGQGTPDPDKDSQHFAFFDAKNVAKFPDFVKGYTGTSGNYIWPWGNAYLVAVEDLPINGRFHDEGPADKDYNDFVVFVANVPDASTWMLFLSGVPALALLRRRRG